MEYPLPKKGTIGYELINGDWQDKTTAQIAIKLGCRENSVKATIRRMKRENGITIEYKKEEKYEPRKSLKHVDKNRFCKTCGYRVFLAKSGPYCQYILLEYHSRPVTVDGVCPVYKRAKKPFAEGQTRGEDKNEMVKSEFEV